MGAIVYVQPGVQGCVTQACCQGALKSCGPPLGVGSGGGLYQMLGRKALFCGLSISVRVKRNTTFSRILKRRLVPAKRAGVEHTILSLLFSNDNRQVHFLLSTHRAAFPPACLGWGQPHLVCDEYRIILKGVDQ